MRNLVASLLLVLFVVFGNSRTAEAYTCGSGWNSYTLTDAHPTVSFEFQPGYAGHHAIVVDHGYPLYVRTRIDWWSNASPTWHNFVDTLYPGTFDLYAGSSDVKFRITFMRDSNNNTDMQVNWKYCLD